MCINLYTRDADTALLLELVKMINTPEVSSACLKTETVEELGFGGWPVAMAILPWQPYP